MFYEENSLKNTEIGEVPNGWSITKFETLCAEIKSGGTPLTSRRDFYNGNIPFVKIEDISSAKKYLSTTKHFLTEKGLKNSNTWIVPSGSLLVAIYGSLGIPAINMKEVTTNQAILGIIPNTNVSVEYLYYLFSNMDLKRYAKQTTQANLTAKIIKNILVPLPPLYEQQKIAEILSNIDATIQKTDGLITSTKRLKTGLMRVLLAKGIDHKKFKETELGRLPEEWKVVRLDTLVFSYKNGIYKPSRFNGKGHQCVRMFNIIEGHVNTLNAPLLDVTEQELEDYGLEEGDILVNRVNTTELVGKAGVVPEGLGKITFESKNIRIRLNKSVILPEFFSILSQTKIYSTQILAKAKTAVAQATITQEDLNTIILPLPSISEQQKIIEIITKLNKKLDVERNEYSTFKRIRQGFMRELLSGKIRVK